MTADSRPRTVQPPADLEELRDLSLFLERSAQPAALLGPDGQQVPLPLEAYNALLDVVEAMRHGRAITVVPTEQRLTTQQAADFLGVSRPTFVRLLEQGAIPHELLPNSRHRRVRLQDLLEYQEKQRTARRAALDELTTDAAAHGLHDVPAEDYADALREARTARGR
ncbi:helix-turn-helix domain-containing protein [uncultured Tessaracoccus sp.]|uniref:helix-turn-helix domain-containing protein n=1 Tax=uncultured Tessaracoccus sp. TaxID=905023 RepID=UPI0025EE5BB3|nr:helix-turn-helix domain-containing protein [uncultured Tessaracoccus sp.]